MIDGDGSLERFHAMLDHLRWVTHHRLTSVASSTEDAGRAFLALTNAVPVGRRHLSAFTYEARVPTSPLVGSLAVGPERDEALVLLADDWSEDLDYNRLRRSFAYVLSLDLADLRAVCVGLTAAQVGDLVVEELEALTKHLTTVDKSLNGVPLQHWGPRTSGGAAGARR